MEVRCKFQFPSSGKVHPKICPIRIGIRLLRVSIPFKRESPSKENPGKEWRRENGGFNSLQAGKSIQRPRCTKSRQHPSQVSIPFKRESPSKVKGTSEESLKSLEFQFPSSGKVHPKSAFSDPVRLWLRTPKTKHELHNAFFRQK